VISEDLKILQHPCDARGAHQRQIYCADSSQKIDFDLHLGKVMHKFLRDPEAWG